MAGLHFDITADNSNFVQRMNEIRNSVNTAAKVLDSLGKNFDVSSTENKILSLGKVIKENELVITSLQKEMQQWKEDARGAFNNSDFETFNTITKDIEEQQNKINQLTQETKTYYDVLQMVEQSSGSYTSSSVEVTAPMFFSNQQDYEYAEKLRDKIDQLQEQIASFEGSEESLQPLRNELTNTQNVLRSVEIAAAKAASSLGGDLGSKAAETSSRLYELNIAVENQEKVLKLLKQSLEEASERFEELKESEDSEAIEEARIKYELLATSVQNAQNELFNLQSAQSDLESSFQQINGEIQQHDSIIVKMLGGYQNYQSVISNLPGPIQNVIGSLNGMTGAAKAFIATPLGAIIAALVIGLQALKTWFDSSVDGQRAFAEISGYVSGVLNQFKEIVISVGKAIYNAFKDPKKAIEDLWKAIKTNIVNRFKSVGELSKSLGGLIKAAFTFDVEGIKREMKNLTNSFLQFGTGVENVTGKVSNYVKGVNEAAKANARLSKEEKDIQIAESEEKVKSSERNIRMSELRADLRSKDKTKRQKAIEEYTRLSNEQMESDLAIQDRKIALQREKMSLTTNSIEDENTLRDLEAQRNNIQAQNAQRKAMLSRFANGLSNGMSEEQIISRQKQAGQKVTELIKQQSEERLRIQQETEFEIWQNKINLMKEGEAKVLAQLALNNEREKIALEQQKNDAIKEEITRQKAVFDAIENEKSAQNKKYAKKIFNSGDENLDLSQSISQLNDIDDQIKEINKQLDNPDVWNLGGDVVDKLESKLEKLSEKKTEIKIKFGDIDTDYLQQIARTYKTLQDQQTAIQQKAEQDRLDEAKSAMNEYLKAYGTFQQKKQAIEEEYANKIAEASNAGERMKEMANRDNALAELNFQEWQDTGGLALAFGDVSKLSKETISELIAQMELYRSKVIATFDPDKIQKFEMALANLRSAEKDYDIIFGAENDIVSAMKERLSLQKQINELERSQEEMLQERRDIEFQLNTLKMQGITPGMNPSGTDEEGNPIYENGITQDQVILAEELQNKLLGIENAFKSSVARSKELTSQLQSMRSVKFADIQKFTSQLLTAGQNAAELASIFGDDVADGIGTAVDSVGTLFNAFETLSSNIEALSKSAIDVVEKTTNASENIVEASSQGMKASATATATSLSTMEKASAILAIIGAAIQVATLVASLFNSDKKHERNIENLQKKIDALQNSYDKLGKAADKAYSSDASKMIEQQNTLLKQQKILIQRQMAEEQAKKKTDDDKLQNYRDKLIEINELLESNKEKAKDAIFGNDLNSAIENFADAYADAWNEGTDKAESAKDTVKNMMQQMVKESIKAAIQSSEKMLQIREKLEDFYKDGVLQGWEIDYIYGMAEELQKELDDKFNWADALMQGDNEREGTSKGITTASQDSVDELNARVTTIQGHTYMLAENSEVMLYNVSQILNYIISIELLQRGIDSVIRSMDKRMQLMASDLSDINTRGVRLI